MMSVSGISCQLLVLIAVTDTSSQLLAPLSFTGMSCQLLVLNVSYWNQ